MHIHATYHVPDHCNGTSHVTSLVYTMYGHVSRLIERNNAMHVGE